MRTKDSLDILQTCCDNICKNFNIPANLRVQKFLEDKMDPRMFTAFVDVYAASMFTVHEEEILQQIVKRGIKHKMDYRRLRNLIKTRLKAAIRNLHYLTHDSLKNLGEPIND